MILDDLFTLLSSAGTTSDGTTISLGAFAEKHQDRAIVLIEYGGLGPTHGMANAAGLALLETVRVQVTSRALDYPTARSKAHAIYKVLDGLPERTINGIRYMSGVALQPPFSLGPDENNRSQVAVNYEFCKSLST